MAKCTVHRPHVTVTLNMTEEEASNLVDFLERHGIGPDGPVLAALKAASNA